MALSANTVWEIRPGGADTNGGGFVTGASGTDHTLQDAAQYSVTDAVTAGTTTITSVTANFGTDVVGNILYIQGGTGAIVAGWYQITARGSSTSITVDRSTGLTIGTGATLKIGGALASPGMCAFSAVSAQIVYIKAGTYTITTASTNVSNGCLAATAARWIGYNSTRSYGNTDTKPVIKLGAGVSSATVTTTGFNLYYNIEFDGNAQTTSKYTSSTTAFFIRCALNNFSAAPAATYCFYCTATGNSAGSFAGPAWYCEAYANTSTPFTGVSAFRSIASGNTGATTDGFSSASGPSWISNVSALNGRDGYRLGSGNAQGVVNSIAISNSGWGVNYTSGTTLSFAYGFATYNNTSGRATGLVYDQNGVTLSGDPFVDSGNNNFALNNTAGAGASLRAAGFPATFPRGTTASYPDIGAAQHEETATVSETSHAFA